jgi:hypothetical protein
VRAPLPVVVALALLALLAGSAGCGKPAVLDGPRSEDRIAERLAEAYGVEVRSVACPEDIEVEEDATFRCTARVGDGRVEVDVRQTDGEGTLEVEARAAILSTPRIEDGIATTLADRFERDDVEVTCPGPAVRIEETGTTFACEAVDGDETKAVEVRVRDTRGALAYTLG